MTTFYDGSLSKADWGRDNQVRQSVTRPRFFPERSWWQIPRTMGTQYPAGTEEHLWLVWCHSVSHLTGDSGRDEEEALPRMAQVTRDRPELPRARESSGSPHEWTPQPYALCSLDEKGTISGCQRRIRRPVTDTSASQGPTEGGSLIMRDRGSWELGSGVWSLGSENWVQPGVPNF